MYLGFPKATGLSPVVHSALQHLGAQDSQNADHVPAWLQNPTAPKPPGPVGWFPGMPAPPLGGPPAAPGLPTAGVGGQMLGMVPNMGPDLMRLFAELAPKKTAVKKAAAPKKGFRSTFADTFASNYVYVQDPEGIYNSMLH